MHEYQLSFAGESDEALAEILVDPYGVRVEDIRFGENFESTGLAIYLTPDNQDHFKKKAVARYAVDFLQGLSEDSYYKRFISPRPSEDKLKKIAKHFIQFDGRYHTTIAVLHDDRLIAAASAFKPKLEPLQSMPIAEVSLTVADAFQRQGLGRQLLERVSTEIIDQGFSHVVANFEKENTPSMKLLNNVFGSNNLVAGKANLETRFYRLGVTNPTDDAALEAEMRGLAEPGLATIYPIETTSIKDKPDRMARFAQQFSKIVSAVIDTTHVDHNHDTSPRQLSFDELTSQM